MSPLERKQTVAGQLRPAQFWGHVFSQTHMVVFASSQPNPVPTAKAGPQPYQLTNTQTLHHVVTLANHTVLLTYSDI